MQKPSSQEQANNLYQTQSDVSLGATALLGEIFLSMIIAAAIKFLSGEVSIPAILLFRYAFSLPILVLIAFYQRGRNALKVVDAKALALRIVFGLLGLPTWFLAISTIDLTKATALSQTMTVFITILAPLLLGEKVGIRRWSAVLIGLVGALILLQPGTEGWLQPGVLYGIAAPFFAALMFVFLRKLGRSDAPATTATLYNCCGTLVFGMWCLLANVNWPSGSVDWLLLIGCGLLAGVQQLLMAWSHKLAPASTLAPLHYFAVPMAIFVGILIFDERITGSFLLGTSVLIGSTYYILVRDRKVRRKSRKSS